MYWIVHNVETKTLYTINGGILKQTLDNLKGNQCLSSAPCIPVVILNPQ